MFKKNGFRYLKFLLAFCRVALPKVSRYLLIGMTAQASMAPRMYSVMAQASSSVVDGISASGTAVYGNRVSLEAL